MSLRLFLFALALSGASASAYADSITDFNFSAALQSGTAQGTITIDATSGQVTGGNFTVNAPAPPGLPAIMDTFTTLQNASYNGTNQIADFASGTDTFERVFPAEMILLANVLGRSWPHRARKDASSCGLPVHACQPIG